MHHLIIVVKNSLYFLVLDMLCPCVTSSMKLIALLGTCKVELNLSWPAIHIEETAVLSLYIGLFLSAACR